MFIESRSGRTRGGLARNPDYERLLELVLKRAGGLDAALIGAWVESEYTAHLSEDQRLLNAEAYPYPIELHSVADFRQLRVMLSRPQGGIGRRPGARGPGNRNKRLKMSFKTPVQWSLDDLTGALTAGDIPGLEFAISAALSRASLSAVPTAGSVRVQAVLSRYESASPTIQQRVSRYIERGPIGDLVKAANGHRCQVCIGMGANGVGFRKPDGIPYVEAHHVLQVSSGAAGVLRAENVMTLCPGHHRELHYGALVVVVDLLDRFEVTVELGTVIVPKPRDLLSTAQ
ncbi:HNH endonuclease [Mesorhizobium australicum]|uniref:HNH endonuclease n=1 Tax=Mesorhizobium australicum TaxID=536018 RepID=UPI00333642A9